MPSTRTGNPGRSRLGAVHFFLGVIDTVSGSATSDEGAAIDATRHVAVAASRACNRRVEVRPLLGLAD